MSGQETHECMKPNCYFCQKMAESEIVRWSGYLIIPAGETTAEIRRRQAAQRSRDYYTRNKEVVKSRRKEQFKTYYQKYRAEILKKRALRWKEEKR